MNGSYKQTTEILNKIKTFCADQLALTVSEKTRITNSYKDKILFLGVHIKHSTIQRVSRYRGVIRRNPKALLLTAPMGIIKSKLKAAGFTKENFGQTRKS